MIMINEIGTSNASYPITYCGLRGPRLDCALEKVTITGGKFITAGVTTAIGKRDKGILIKARDVYLLQVMWVAKQYILLFDVNDRRAWLVDGASALLHLVRCSINNMQEDKEFGGQCLFTWDHFREAAEQVSGKQAAVSMLIDERNIQQKIFKRKVEEWQEDSIDSSGNVTVVTKSKKSFFHFSDKVEQICQILEEIVDRQTAVAGEDGLKISTMSPRRRLLGYDFVDIVEDRDLLYLKVYDPHDFGRGWVDLVTAIRATTLFGNGFGELIKPRDPAGLCSNWTEVPKSKDYLAVSVSTMTELLQRGNKNEVPWRIVDDIYWHSPGNPFGVCQCGDVSSCDPVQVLLPSGFQKRWGKSFKSPTVLHDKGALIFGNSRLFPLQGGVHDDPIRRITRRNRGKIEEHRDATAAQSSMSSRISNSLFHSRGINTGKNSLLPRDTLPNMTSSDEAAIIDFPPKMRLQSFWQVVREFCHIPDGVIGNPSSESVREIPTSEAVRSVTRSYHG